MSDKLKELPANFIERSLSQRLDWISENWNVTRQMAEEFVSRYDEQSNYLRAKHAEKDRLKAQYKDTWSTAEDNIQAWGMSEQIFRSRVLPELPVYESPEKTSDPINARIPVEPHSRGFWGDPPDDLSSPSNWWVRNLDVDLYRQLHPELFGPIMYGPVAPPETVIRWVLTDGKSILEATSMLEEWVIGGKLTAVRLDSWQGTVPVKPKEVKNFGLRMCMFLESDLRDFRSQNPHLFPLTKKKTKYDEVRILFVQKAAELKGNARGKSRLQFAHQIKNLIKGQAKGDFPPDSTLLTWLREYVFTERKGTKGRPAKGIYETE